MCEQTFLRVVPAFTFGTEQRGGPHLEPHLVGRKLSRTLRGGLLLGTGFILYQKIHLPLFRKYELSSFHVQGTALRVTEVLRMTKILSSPRNLGNQRKSSVSTTGVHRADLRGGQELWEVL